MAVYYNEFDPHAAEWLRDLQRDGLIPEGEVDERPIQEVRAEDLRGFDQCHFFAGIGGWAYALELAGWGSDPVWTGSCPCQPYSAAGKGKGDSDPRNLWPQFFRLVRECRPPVVVGEQVPGAIRHGWLDRVSADLEGEGYAVGAVVLGAHSVGEEVEGRVRRGDQENWERVTVGAPHIRQRLYWVGERVAESESTRGREIAGAVRGSQATGLRESQGEDERRASLGTRRFSYCGSVGGVADAERDAGESGRSPVEPGEGPPASGTGTPTQPRRRGGSRGLADPDGGHPRDGGVQRGGEHGLQPESGRTGGLAHPHGESRLSGEGEQLHERHPGVGQPGEVGGDGLGDSSGTGLQERVGHGGVQRRAGRPQSGEATELSGYLGFWSAFDLVPCRDGKARRIEPGSQCLVDGVPFRLADGRTVEKASRNSLLKGFGNAIVPGLAAEFLLAYRETLVERVLAGNC